MRFIVCLWLALAVAACDTSTLTGGDTPFVYATDGTDTPGTLLQTPSGDLVVVGSTEGTLRPADGTLALPSVLRFGLDGELQAAEVYRDVGYGSVGGAAWTPGGLVVSLSAGPDGPGDRTVGVYRVDEDGRRRSALLERNEGYAFGGLVPMPGSGVVARISTRGGAPDIHRLDADGAAVWTTRLGKTQEAFGLAEAPGGDVYAHGPMNTGPDRWVVARLDGATGAERWRAVRPEGWDVVAFAPSADGLVLVEGRHSFQEGSEVRVVWLGADGAERRHVSVERTPGSPDGEAQPDVRAFGGAVAALAGGSVVMSLTRRPFEFAEPPEVSLVVLAPDGTERDRERFGVRGRWSLVSDIEPLADGRIAVAGAVGPRRVSGYGGDDFDIWVSLYDVAGG